MILIYTNKITPRIRYIFKQIFTRILLIDINFTTKVEDFVAYNGIKLSYAKHPLGGEFFIESHNLLFEQGIHDIDITISHWDKIPCFFESGAKSSIPFDIFSASFYLISRYEEYLPNAASNEHEFRVTQSIAYLNNFLEKPLIDIWAYKLLDLIKTRFNECQYKEKTYSYISVIDIDRTFIFKHKTIFQGTIELLNDLYQLRIYKVIDRISTILNFKKDPYDNYKKIISLQNKYNIKTIFFFLISNTNKPNGTISHFRKKIQLLIKDMVDYSTVGLHPSIKTLNKPQQLKKEKEILENITHMAMTYSRQEKSYFKIPKTYQNLIDQEVTEDYSMGYSNHTGFRASTCTPFYFYDISFEIQTPLKIFPTVFSDIALKEYMKLTPKQSIGKARDLHRSIKQVNGCFISVFNNQAISGYDETWSGWQNLYENVIKVVSK